MNSPIPVTAIFDIGKTNKKFFLFDEEYSIIQKQQTKMAQITDDDGDLCEDLSALEEWVKKNLREALKNKNLKVHSLNFSTYGASLVHLDDEGNKAAPLYNYLKPYPEDLLNKFYNSYKGKRDFSLETASPPMGMLNSGLQLYWLKYEKPKKFQKITHSLHFPQYLSYLITGEFAAELTSIGSHTALWNFEQDEYHPWVKQEELLKLLPEVHPVTKKIDATWEGKKFRTGIGIHDSSAALAPYLFALEEPFMLISTGTWSISFNPFNKEPLTFEELQRDCLCYLNIQGEQVKAARFFLGNEYSQQKEKLKEYFKISEKEEPVELDSALIKELVRKKTSSQKLKLEQAYNSGPFPQNKPGDWQVNTFNSYKEAYHQLMLDLVAIQAESIKLALGKNDIKKLIITGGFSQNEFFVTLLACFFPDKKIYTSNLPNASALGAAMVVNDKGTFYQDKQAGIDLLGLQQHDPCSELEIKEYSWKESVFN